jgi:hypothetical protein
MAGLVLKTRSLAELIEEERAPRPDEASRQLPALHDVFKLCLDCPLADCDEDDPGCLLRIQARRDPKVRQAVRYQRWLEKNLERKRRVQRASDAKRRARLADGKSTSAPG